jgi:hypothetical protein
LYNASKDLPATSFPPDQLSHSYTTGPLRYGRLYNVSVVAVNHEAKTGE